MEIKRTLCGDVLRRYGKAIVHMRQQIEDKRFGMVIGAGASMDLGFPNWPELVRRIASHPEVKGAHLVGKDGKNTSESQLLYQHYRETHAVAAGGMTGDAFNRVESLARAGWQRIVRDSLYENVPKETDELLKQDKYLKCYLEVVRDTRLTINYNFDDTLQRMLDHTAGKENSKQRSHSTVWNANIQMFPRDGVIYHPNGYLPRDLAQRPSEQLVFLEDSFADQLIDSMAGHYTALSYHLAQATRLLLGLSLNDATLKHLLRQNAQSHPGHYHYYIAFVPDGETRDAAYEQTVVAANFSVYNLITLFLTVDEIAALGNLLTMRENDFVHLAEEVGCPTKLRFLITGAVGVGKSTTLSHFRSLRSYDEWLEPRKPGMEKDPSKVDSTTIQAIDEWVAKQLNLKNLAMLDARTGIHVVDRAPLDAFAFTPIDKWQEKAKFIREAVSPGVSKRRLVEAHIILLTGDPQVIAVRAIAKHRDTDEAALKKQQELLVTVYCRAGSPTSVVDARDKSIKQVVRDVARIIHLGEYAEAPLHDWLGDLERGDHHA